MLIDMWRHFPKKFKDSIVQDQVLEEIKNSLRMHQVSSIQTVAIFGQLVGLFEFIVEQKLDQYGKVTADKIANLILHVLMDFNPANTAVKEFMLEQAFLLLKKDLLDLNECIRVFLRIFQNMSNAFGVSDVKIVGYLMSRVDDLSDKNLLNLLDFNCHLFMNDTCAMDFSKQNIVTLTGFLKQNDSVITHFVKFIRLVFNWLYKTRLSHNKGPHPELNAAREKQMLDLIRLLLYSEKTNLRIWVVAHNMAALTNFQLRKYLGTRRSRTKDPFVDGYRPLILAPNPLDTRNPEAEKLTPEEIMLRFDRVFELHLNDTAGKELEGQLDKLVTSVDLCKKFQPDDLEFTQGDDLADYPRVESELSRHKARMEALKKKEEKLQKIKQGVFADKKAIHQLSLIREKRVQKEHDKIQTEAQKSIIELEQVNKYAKQAEDIKILTGTRKEDAVELTIEQLTKPLGTHQ